MMQRDDTNIITIFFCYMKYFCYILLPVNIRQRQKVIVCYLFHRQYGSVTKQQTQKGLKRPPLYHLCTLLSPRKNNIAIVEVMKKLRSTKQNLSSINYFPRCSRH